MSSKLAIALALALCVSFGPAMAQEVCTTPEAGPALGVMPLKPNPRLFTFGNFHSKMPGGIQRAKERDLVYVSTQEQPGGAHRHILTVLVTNGNGCFSAPLLSNAVLGEEPTLIAVGKFNASDEDDDIAIIDTRVDTLNLTPVLRIFLGDGKGRFKEGDGVSTFALERDEIPVAMATGRFRGPSKPIDIAIASIAKDPSAPSVVRVLTNNGQGEFARSPELAPRLLGDFKPAVMLAADKFRDGAKLDIVLKEKVVAGSADDPNRKRVLYLRNSGNGNFPEVTMLQNAGSANALLLGVLSTNDTGADKLDIVTFDDDTRLRIFENDGGGRFALHDPNDVALNRHVGAFVFGATKFEGLKQFFVAEGERTLRLTAIATSVSDGRQGTVTLAADNQGGFKPAEFRAMTPPLSVPAGVTPVQEGIFGPNPRPHRAVLTFSPTVGVVAPLRRNGRAALALVSRVLEIETKAGTCLGSPASVLSYAPVAPLPAAIGGRCRPPVPTCGDQDFPRCVFQFADGTCKCKCMLDENVCRHDVTCGTDASGATITPQCSGPLGPDGLCNCFCPHTTPICAPPRTCDAGSPYCTRPLVMGQCPCRCSGDSDACRFTRTFPSANDPPLLIVFGLP